MKILVTGAKGFIGKNLVVGLKSQGYTDIFEYDIEDDKFILEKYARECEFVFHLAGVNRPKDVVDYMKGNFGFTSYLLNRLKRNKNKASILITSSIQAEGDSPYGKSKKAAEELLWRYSKETGAKVFVYRLPNLFGKWSRPNYNTVVATFCHNIARGLEIQVNNPDAELTLCYIDDVIGEFIQLLERMEKENYSFCYISTTYKITLKRLAELIGGFKKSRQELSIFDMKDNFIKKLYSTYLSFLPEDKFSYNLKMNCDNRGSFTEFIRTPERGQVSVNISKPGVVKGNHWHNTKNEKFLVVSGKGVIRFRKVNSQKVIEYFVCGDKMEVVDVPIGYTHNIENLGDTDMVTIMWVNECFDSEKPDTYYLEV